ncbi:MAG: DUF2163 domain-containing protein [Proteobacteria bacterium]|nr:DUF2163 domain-containing protein [Pseudomonadota bacterium]
MRKVLWEPAAGQLVAFLAANTQAVPVDLYKITLQNGTVLHYTNAEQDIWYNDATYSPGPGLVRSKTRFTAGIAVDTMEIQLFADSSIRVGSMGIIAAIAFGLFDGADVQVAHAFFDGFQAWQMQGVVLAFAGRVGQTSTQRGQANIEVRSYSELFDIMVPGDLYQPGCKNTLYDAYCGVSRSSAAAAGSVTGGITAANNYFVSSVPVGAGASRYMLGTLTFTSGGNAGIARTIKRAVAAGGTVAFEFISPFPYPLAVGDAFTAQLGCDKTRAACAGVFGNDARFRGEPLIPAPETVT